MTARGYGAGPRTRVAEPGYGAVERAVLAIAIALCAVAAAAVALGRGRVLLLPAPRGPAGRRAGRGGGRDPRPARRAPPWCCAGERRHRPRPALHLRRRGRPGAGRRRPRRGGGAGAAARGALGRGQVHAPARALRAGAPLPRRAASRAGSSSTATTPSARRRPRICRSAAMVFQDPEAQAVLGAVERDVAFGLESAGIPARVDPRRGWSEALEMAGAVAPARRGPSASCRAASASASRWRRSSRPGRGWSSSTSPPHSSTTARRRRSWTCCAPWPRGAPAVVVAEHRIDRARTDRRPRAGGPGRPHRRARTRRSRCRLPRPRRGRPGAGAGPAGGGPRRATRGARCCAARASTLRAGEVVTISGDNGSGKSTLLRVLAGPPRARRRGRGAGRPRGHRRCRPSGASRTSRWWARTRGATCWPSASTPSWPIALRAGPLSPREREERIARHARASST